MFTRRDLLIGAASQIASFSLAAASAAEERAPALRRGVNLSHWFAQSFEPDTPNHYSSFIGAKRMTQLARCGFDHVRLPVDPALLFQDSSPSGFRTTTLDHLRMAIELLHSRGLSVVVDLHPVGSAKDILLTREGQAAFIRNWKKLAAICSQADDHLYLEILNEPTPLQGKAWWDLQSEAIDAIRDVNPRTCIIANGGNWSNIEDLIANEPYADPRIIYTAHYYAPILFTQQGTDWGWKVAGRVAHLNWPLEPQSAMTAAQSSCHDDEARYFVREAVESGSFSRSDMIETFAKLSRWQKASGRPAIYIGEFGVVAQRPPPEARLRWLHTARTEFESNGWGWAAWDLSPSFGLLKPTPANPYAPWPDLPLDPETLTALGMTH